MRARKIDQAQPGIVAALERVGAEVLSLASYGVSCDLLVQHRGKLWLMEVKNPGPPSSKKLTDMELNLARRFPIAVVTTPAEAMRVIGL